MARKSKRLHSNSIEKTKVSAKIFKAGIYARLSSDQNEKRNESIEVQVDMARSYVENWNRNHENQIEIVEYYKDLGKTGTNFNRAAFNCLMQDIRLGVIDCVIVKDLSRFGRNYLEAGNYIEKIFPFLGVRFIAISDGYDTGVSGNHTKQMASEIKNLVNDMYAKDFSKKAKVGLKQRREEGSYVGGPPPYGYETAWEGRIRKLIPDKNTAEIVSYIFEQFVRTHCYQAVTDDLNQRRINPPAIYKKTGEVYCPQDTAYKGWDKGSVERILKNETYIGRLVQGKTSITAKNEKIRIHKDKQEWVIKEQAHEGLIDQKLFEQTTVVIREIRNKTENYKSHSADCPIEENIFDRVLFCGSCGRKMTRTSRAVHYKDGRICRVDGYLCLNTTSTKTEKCPASNRISKMELEAVLYTLLEEEFVLNLGKKKNYIEKCLEYIRQEKLKLEQEQRQTEYTLAALEEEEGRKYLDYRMGNIQQKDYVDYKMKKEEQHRELESRKQGLEADCKRLVCDGEIYLKAIRSLLRWNKKREMTKELVETLIEKIYVYPGKRVEVLFLYTDAFRRGAMM